MEKLQNTDRFRPPLSIRTCLGVFIYDNFLKYKSWRAVLTFDESFPDLPEPSKAMIYNLVKIFCITGSVMEKKQTCEACSHWGDVRWNWPPTIEKSYEIIPLCSWAGRSVAVFRDKRYLAIKRGLTWKPHIDKFKQKASQKLGIQSPLLNRRSSLSIGNGVLLYKQLIRPMMGYACPVWRHVAPGHLKSLQVIQSKCLRSVTGAPWYVSNARTWGFPI